ncbi:MAG: spoIIM [Bacilli bacterium]|nr:spoIIM [Bacilli bacterium]
MSDLPRAMRNYLKEHLPLYVFVSVLFITGVIFGAVIVQALTLEQKQELSRHLGNFFQLIDQGSEFDGKRSFLQSLMMNLKWLALIWLFGLSVIGLPLILIMDFVKGVFVGFTVGFMVGEYAWKGMLFALVSVVPQNLLMIPVLLICSVSAISFAVYLIKHRFLKQQLGTSVPLAQYMGTSLSLAIILFGVSFYEALLSPLLMKWVTPMLLSFG